MILNRTIDSYHFGFSLNLREAQLRTLTGLFDHPDPSGVSLLGGRTSVTPVQLDGIGSVVIKHYRRGGLMRYFIKRRYFKYGKTRARREFELLDDLGTLGINVPQPIAYARRGRLFYRAWLVTREIHQPLSLARLSLQDQKQAAIFFDACNGRALLGDQPGVGKTAAAMTYSCWKGKKTLIVCPANLRLNWRNEILKFTKEKAFVYKWKPTKKSGKINHPKSESMFNIMSYSSLDTYITIEMSHTCKNVFCGWKERNGKKRYKDKVCPNCGVRNMVTSRATKNITFTPDKMGEVLNAEDYDILIMDEAHYIKNNSADRTKLAKKTLKDIPQKLLLTGTAIKSRPYEFFSLLNFLYPEEWSNAHSFGVKYCAAEKNNFGWDYSGASNLDELFEKISPFFLRRLKKDILKHLPPKTYTAIPVELTPIEMREYNKIKKGIKEESAQDDQEADNRMNHLTRIQKLKQFTSEIKMKRAFEFIQDIIDGDEKVVVFSQYKGVSYEVANKFGDKAVVFNGDINANKKEEAVEAFMTDDNVKVFSGTIGAAGVGITLTSASISIFIDQPWTSADREQAEDRIHRASSKSDKIQIIRLICQDTIDEDIEKLLNQKSSILSKVLDGKEFEQTVEVKDGNIFGDLIKLLYN